MKRGLSPDDILSLRDTEGEEFGRARILWVKSTIFDRLTEEDRNGHESFDSKEDMYDTYSGYYDREVGPETPVKVVRFELLDEDP
ncbi:MAG: ASCH domain-containing protein [Candidatus Nanohaloarchaea archaeon]